MKEIEVTIDTNGEVSIDLIGFKGKGCAEVADKLAKALGTQINRDKKCEYWEETVKEKQKVKNRI